MVNMKRMLSRIAAAIFLFSVGAAEPIFADAAAYHGADAVFKADGITILWAILKSKDEASSVVYMRILAADSALTALGSFKVIARDVLSGAEAVVEARGELRGENTVTETRAAFNDKAQRRFLFYAGRLSPAEQKPKVEIYYYAIPDTTPEFLSKDSLEKYLSSAAQRIGGRN